MMDRKKFIKLVSAGSLCGSAVVGLSGCTTYTYLAAEQTDGRLSVPIAGLTGEPFVLIRHPGSEAPIYLASIQDGEYMALFLECTHRQCVVDPSGGQFECPCHGSRFDGHGDVLEGPAREPLASFPVTADDTHIHIEYS